MEQHMQKLKLLIFRLFIELFGHLLHFKSNFKPEN